LKFFILAHNDAVPLLQRFNYSDSIGSGVGSFARVVSFDTDIDDDNVTSIALETEDFPRDCVPFGDSGHGDYVCVRVTSEETHDVILWRHEFSGGEQAVKLAESIAEFVAQLCG